MKLEQLYYNPKSPAAYAGEQALYELAKQSSKKVKLQDIRDWCFVVTCWERADLLALVCGVFCEFATFPLVSWVRCGT